VAEPLNYAIRNRNRIGQLSLKAVAEPAFGSCLPEQDRRFASFGPQFCLLVFLSGIT
jgi:hypothetical protein